MDFVSDIALACIAFSVGQFFTREKLTGNFVRTVIITLLEAFTAGTFVTLAIHFLFRQTWSFSLILGAIATATAPAGIMMLIRQYRAEGEFVDLLLRVVALDDVAALLAFSAASAAAQGLNTGAVKISGILLPVVWNLVGIAAGVGCGFLLSRLTTKGKRSTDNRLILSVTALLLLSGGCGILNISPLLACMVFGAVFMNVSGDDDLYRQLDAFTPPVLSCFFILSGMRLELASLRTAGLIGIVYFLVRIAGKYLGAAAGCLLCRTERKTTVNLGIALIPQAGVAIGLSILGERLLPPEQGAMLSAIILSSSVLYELLGPASAKLALRLSGSISRSSPSPPPEKKARLFDGVDSVK